MSLSTVQKHAIDLRVELYKIGRVPTVLETMQAVGKSRDTWYKWLKNPEFRAAYIQAFDCRIRLENSERLYEAIHQPDFPIEQRVRIYLHEKSTKQEIDVKSMTLTDLIKKAHAAD